MPGTSYLFLKLGGTGLMVETPGSSLGTIPLITVCPLAGLPLTLVLCWLPRLFPRLFPLVFPLVFPLLLPRLFPLLLFLNWFLLSLLFLLLKDGRPFPVIWLRLTSPVTLTRSPTLRISSGTWLAGTAKKTVPTETRPSSGSSVVVSSAAEANGFETPERED